MRFRALLLTSAAVVLFAAPLAVAQLAQASFQPMASLPTGPVDPGNETAVTFRVVRNCPNVATVLEAQTLAVKVGPSSGGRASGPEQIQFTQQVCAQQMTQEQSTVWQVAVLDNATRGQALSLVATFKALAASAVTPGSPEFMMPFVVQVSSAPTAPPATVPVREQPGLGLVAVALTLVVALGLRRR